MPGAVRVAERQVTLSWSAGTTKRSQGLAGPSVGHLDQSGVVVDAHSGGFSPGRPIADWVLEGYDVVLCNVVSDRRHRGSRLRLDVRRHEARRIALVPDLP